MIGLKIKFIISTFQINANYQNIKQKMTHNNMGDDIVYENN